MPDFDRGKEPGPPRDRGGVRRSPDPDRPSTEKWPTNIRPEQPLPSEPSPRSSEKPERDLTHDGDGLKHGFDRGKGEGIKRREETEE